MELLDYLNPLVYPRTFLTLNLLLCLVTWVIAFRNWQSSRRAARAGTVSFEQAGTLSLENWTPEYRGRGSFFIWPHGAVATLRDWDEPQKTHQVRIKSDVEMKNGVLACVADFLDGSGCFAVPVDWLEPGQVTPQV